MNYFEILCMAAGWGLAIGFAWAFFQTDTLLRKAWKREDFYRDELLKAVHLNSHPPLS